MPASRQIPAPRRFRVVMLAVLALAAFPAKLGQGSTTPTARLIELMELGRGSSCLLAPRRPPAVAPAAEVLVAARQGEPAAMLRVAEGFLAEPGGAALAIPWLARAAAAGAGGAAADLGRAHWAGHGVRPDAARAVRWWRYGAALGDARAMACLGTAQLLGEGTTPDPVAAAAWAVRRATLLGGAGLLRPNLQDFERGLPPILMLEARARAAEPLGIVELPEAAPDAGPAVPIAPPAPAALPTPPMPEAGVWPALWGSDQTPRPRLAVLPSGTEPYVGTGVVVAAPGVVLTAAHIVESCLDIEAVAGLAGFGGVTVRSVNRAVDLALVSVPGLDRPVLPVAEATRVGTLVAALGFPGQGLVSPRPTVTLGNISAMTGRGDIELLQYTAPTQAGNSGGPLLDAESRIVGLVFATRNAPVDLLQGRNIPQNVNFAVAPASVARFLTDTGVRPRVEAGPPASFAEVAAAAEASIVQIICQRRSAPPRPSEARATLNRLRQQSP